MILKILEKTEHMERWTIPEPDHHDKNQSYLLALGRRKIIFSSYICLVYRIAKDSNADLKVETETSKFSHNH